MSEQKKVFAVIIPNELDLTVPVAAATELSKKYIQVENKIAQLELQSKVIESVDENGKSTYVVIDHPDLKWWFDQGRKILSDIAKINSNMEIKEQENKIKLLQIVAQAGELNQELRETEGKKRLKEKLKKNVIIG